MHIGDNMIRISGAMVNSSRVELGHQEHQRSLFHQGQDQICGGRHIRVNLEEEMMRDLSQEMAVGLCPMQIVKTRVTLIIEGGVIQ